MVPTTQTKLDGLWQGGAACRRRRKEEGGRGCFGVYFQGLHRLLRLEEWDSAARPKTVGLPKRAGVSVADHIHFTAWGLSL